MVEQCSRAYNTMWLLVLARSKTATACSRGAGSSSAQGSQQGKVWAAARSLVASLAESALKVNVRVLNWDDCWPVLRSILSQGKEDPTVVSFPAETTPQTEDAHEETQHEALLQLCGLNPCAARCVLRHNTLPEFFAIPTELRASHFKWIPEQALATLGHVVDCDDSFDLEPAPSSFAQSGAVTRSHSAAEWVDGDWRHEAGPSRYVEQGVHANSAWGDDSECAVATSKYDGGRGGSHRSISRSDDLGRRLNDDNWTGGWADGWGNSNAEWEYEDSRRYDGGGGFSTTGHISGSGASGFGPGGGSSSMERAGSDGERAGQWMNTHTDELRQRKLGLVGGAGQTHLCWTVPRRDNSPRGQTNVGAAPHRTERCQDPRRKQGNNAEGQQPLQRPQQRQPLQSRTNPSHSSIRQAERPVPPSKRMRFR